jgi:CRP-like cAMP-binding protein/small-conductance mechanosensitive channel
MVGFALHASGRWGGGEARTAEFVEESARALITVAALWVAVRLGTVLLFSVYFEGVRGVRIPGVYRGMVASALYFSALIAILHLRFGYALGDLLIAAAALALVAGIVFQGTIGSLLTGFVLSLQNSFREGDLIRLGDHEGRVVRVDWRTTTIRTDSNELVTLANRLLNDGALVNYSRPEPRYRGNVRILASTEARPHRVEAALADCASMVEGVLREPAPAVTYEGTDGRAAAYDIAFWVSERGEAAETASAIRKLAWYRLRRDGIAARSLTGPEPDAGAPTSAPGKPAPSVSTYLEKVPLFAAIRPPELARLDSLALIELYGKGERLFRQGDPGDSLYIVKSGRIEIAMEVEQGSAVARRELAPVGPGGFFGEKSLLTGEPRSATATAAEESELIVIGHRAVQEVLLADPTTAERLSEIVAGREQADREAPAAAPPMARESILARIRSFFALE